MTYLNNKTTSSFSDFKKHFNKRIKKSANYLSILSVAALATSVPLNTAYAGNETITDEQTMDATRLGNVSGSDLQINDSGIANASIAIAATKISDFKLNGSTAAQANLVITNTGAIIIASNVDSLASKAGTISVNFGTAETAASLVTVTGAIASTGLLTNIAVGTATTAGNVSFTKNAALVADNIAVIGGNHADEDSAVRLQNAVTVTAITLDDNLGDAIVDIGTTAAVIVAGTINGVADGEGTLLVSGAGGKTFSGIIGGTKDIATTDINNAATFGAAVSSLNVLIADSITADFDDSLTATTITLGSSTIGGTLSLTADSAQVVAGDIVSFGTDKKGTIVANNTHSSKVTFSGSVGTSALSIALITGTDDAIFSGNVFTESLTVANTKDVDIKADLEIGVTDAILSGAAADLIFSGTVAQSVTGTAAGAVILGAGAGQGLVKVSNAAGVTFDVVLGVDTKELVSFTTSGTAKAVFSKAGHEINDLIIGNNTTIELTTDIAAASTVFTTTSVADSFNAGSTIIMPSNLANGTSVILVKNDDNVNVDEIAEDINTALRDTAVTDFAATVSIGDLSVTATDHSAATVAGNLGTTTNIGAALLQARSAMIAGTATELSTINNLMNVEGGFSATEDTSFARQAAPQTEMFAGSTVAAQGVSGSVQGIMSNRMASLRSGDAFAGTGMSAGGAMSAKSGFVQVFGSVVEQDNKTVGSGTQAGYDADSSGVAIGFDGISDAGTTVGLSLSASNTDVEGKGTGKAKNDMDTYTASIYMDKATDAGYLEGSLTFGLSENTSSRSITAAGLSRTLSGAYDSQQVSLNIGVGMPTEVAVGFVTPFASFTGTQIETDAYTEKSTVAADALRLRVAQDDVSSVVGTVGIKYHNVMDNGGVPMISLAINNEFGDTTITSSNKYTGGGTAFNTSTNIEELSATLGLAYSMGNDRTSIEFAAEADANDDEYISYGGSFKIVGKF
jgi:uncharacterized protein with beta-barrel porin domain